MTVLRDAFIIFKLIMFGTYALFAFCIKEMEDIDYEDDISAQEETES